MTFDWLFEETSLQRDDHIFVFVSEVDIKIISKDGDIDYNKAFLKWKLDLDFRSWGVKDPEIVIDSITGIEGMKINPLEAKKIEFDYLPGDGIYPNSISVHLDSEGNPDICEIEFTYFGENKYGFTRRSIEK